MRKLNIIFCTLCLSVLLTGCVSSRTRECILKALVEEDVISSDWSYISMETRDASPIPDITEYIYTYSNASDYYCVHIYNQVDADNGNDYYWPVSVSDRVYEVKETSVTVSGDTIETVWYEESDESVTINYEVRVHHFLFWKWYSVKCAD